MIPVKLRSRTPASKGKKDGQSKFKRLRQKLQLRGEARVQQEEHVLEDQPLASEPPHREEDPPVHIDEEDPPAHIDEEDPPADDDGTEGVVTMKKASSYI